MSSIALVEDDTGLRENLALLLELSGFAVSSYAEGSHALLGLETGMPDLILCDVRMPGIDGFEVLRKVRELQGGRLVPFVFISAHADREVVRRGMVDGADDYLTKPFSAEDLIATVKTRLRIAEYRRKVSDALLRTHSAKVLESLPHEIRTPLNGIVGAFEILKFDMAGGVGDHCQAMDLMEMSVNRLERTLLRYLSYLEISAGRNPCPVLDLRTVGEILARTVAKCSVEWGREKDIHLECRVSEQVKFPECLERALTELIDNSLKFSLSGTRVIVEAWTGESFFHVRIADNGHGMEPEEISKVGPFCQFAKNYFDGMGLGIGLSIADGLLAAIGGRFQIKTNSPQGLVVDVMIEKETGRLMK